MNKSKKSPKKQPKKSKKLTREQKYEKVYKQVVTDRAVRKNLVTRNLRFFFPVYFHKYIKFETAPFQEEIFKILENEKLRLAVILAFRGSAKSTIITTAYALWSILGAQQKKFVVIVSQTEQKTRVHLNNIKTELETNHLLKTDLGPFEEERNQWGATALTLPKLGAKIMISSTEQSIRGLRYLEHRPDLIILDDVEDINSVRNQENRNKLFNWFTSEILPAGEAGTRIILVGNLLHDDSLVKRIQNKVSPERTDWVYKEYPITDEFGNPTWPGKYPTKEHIEIQRQDTLDEATWQREYQLKIVDHEYQIIKRDWIQYYDGQPPEPNFHSHFGVGVDLAISQKDTADYTAIVSGQIQSKYDKDFKIYILPNIVNRRMTGMEALEAARQVSDSIPHRNTIYIEDNGYQGIIVEQLKDERYDAEGVKSKAAKADRLSAVSYLVQSGHVLFPKEGAEELIMQILDFGIEKHDDLVDAFSLLLARLAHECHGPRCEFVDNPHLF